jgi:hypothetical protein
MKVRNPVAKFARKYNKANVFKDKKREWKKTGGRCDLDVDFYDSADNTAEVKQK